MLSGERGAIVFAPYNSTLALIDKFGFTRIGYCDSQCNERGLQDYFGVVSGHQKSIEYAFLVSTKDENKGIVIQNGKTIIIE